MTAVALALEDVTCRFAARDGGASYTAVANTTLRVAEGEFVSVVGPTGCGKSTLLNVAAGLLEKFHDTNRPQLFRRERRLRDSIEDLP